MKFKIGDRVKVIKCNVNGDYCENINKISTITQVKKDVPYPYMLKDLDEVFSEDEIELVRKERFTKADLKGGDKCTLKNGQVVFVDKTSNYCFENIDEQLKYFNDDVSIVKVERPIKYETLFERKEEILDKTEKRYLSGVIRPFKDKVIFISKDRDSNYDKEFIFIELKNESIYLPNFKINTMYKGMKEDKKYTLKELGL